MRFSLDVALKRLRVPPEPRTRIKVDFQIEMCLRRHQGCNLEEAETSVRRRFFEDIGPSACLSARYRHSPVYVIGQKREDL